MLLETKIERISSRLNFFDNVSSVGGGVAVSIALKELDSPYIFMGCIPAICDLRIFSNAVKN
jgi:hypothetical protein